MLTSKALKKIVHYNPRTGIFTWTKVSKYHPYLLGATSGTTKISKGKEYIVIRIDGAGYLAHRLAWLYIYGRWPQQSIDHKNGNSLDNWILNLRDCDQTSNVQNHAHTINKSGLPNGVRILPNGRYQARITAKKIMIYLGTFSLVKEAELAYLAARVKLHDCPILTGEKL